MKELTQLPTKILDWFESDDVTTAIALANRDLKVSDARSGVLLKALYDIETGLLVPSKLHDRLSYELGLPEKDISDAVERIENAILRPIVPDLIAAHGEEFSLPLSAVEPETEKKNFISLEDKFKPLAVPLPPREKEKVFSETVANQIKGEPEPLLIKKDDLPEPSLSAPTKSSEDNARSFGPKEAEDHRHHRIFTNTAFSLSEHNKNPLSKESAEEMPKNEGAASPLKEGSFLRAWEEHKEALLKEASSFRIRPFSAPAATIPPVEDGSKAKDVSISMTPEIAVSPEDAATRTSAPNEDLELFTEEPTPAPSQKVSAPEEVVTLASIDVEPFEEASLTTPTVKTAPLPKALPTLEETENNIITPRTFEEVSAKDVSAALVSSAPLKNALTETHTESASSEVMEPAPLPTEKTLEDLLMPETINFAETNPEIAAPLVIEGEQKRTVEPTKISVRQEDHTPEPTKEKMIRPTFKEETKKEDAPAPETQEMKPFILHEERTEKEPGARSFQSYAAIKPSFYKPSFTSSDRSEGMVSARLEFGSEEEANIPVVGRTTGARPRVVHYSSLKTETPFGRSPNVPDGQKPEYIHPKNILNLRKDDPSLNKSPDVHPENVIDLKDLPQ